MEARRGRDLYVGKEMRVRGGGRWNIVGQRGERGDASRGEEWMMREVEGREKVLFDS